MRKALMAFDEGEKPQSAVCRFDQSNFTQILKVGDEELSSEKQYFKKYGQFDQLTLNDYSPG